MNTRLLAKLIFVLLVLLFMVMMGMENNIDIEFRLLKKDFGKIPAAIMYFIFMGAGILLGAIVVVGWRGAGKR